MKVKERRYVPTGFAGRHEERVRELKRGEKRSADAERVPDETPAHDWREAKES